MLEGSNSGPDSRLASRIFQSPNFGVRIGGTGPSILLLHYTGMPSVEAAIRLLAAPESKVSCHYVVGEDGAVTQMVAEAHRAWHAGASYWRGVSDINSCSIGIEIQNPGHEAGYPDFSDVQMDAVEALCLDIIARHSIASRNVLAHSDVAPRRKIDPGEKFDWARLARAGVGHWTEPVPHSGSAVLGRGAKGPAVMCLQERLRTYGYGVPCTGEYCEETEFAVAAFQRHFRPALVNGRAGHSTMETMLALLSKL